MINLSVCTISFRHQLISMEQLADWARAQQFQGIELWGIHARNLAQQPQYDAEWLASFGLYTTMVSDYLPLDGDAQETQTKARILCECASRWGTHKIRSFAGNLPSHQVDAQHRQLMVKRLRSICEYVHQQGCQLLLETHPNTLADNAASTGQLLAEVDHPALKINFDVLHLWEAGDDPVAVFKELKPFIQHFHLKNIQARHLLPVFAPANVYSPAGCRKGMVSLFEGEFDYLQFFSSIFSMASGMKVEASLEWFGSQVKETLKQDRDRLAQLGQQLTKVNALHVSQPALVC
jgi:3-dehydroshikimate dehydratase